MGWETQRVKAVNMCFWHLMNWLEALAMRLASIGIKQSNNISLSGIKINMRHLVGLVIEANLGLLICVIARFIRNHYREASESVHILTDELVILKATLKLTDADFQCFLVEERTYLTSLKQPLPNDQLKIRYVQILDELEEHK